MHLAAPAWARVDECSQQKYKYVKEQPEIVSHYSLSSIRPTCCTPPRDRAGLEKEPRTRKKTLVQEGEYPLHFFRLPVDENYPR